MIFCTMREIGKNKKHKRQFKFIKVNSLNYFIEKFHQRTTSLVES